MRRLVRGARSRLNRWWRPAGKGTPRPAYPVVSLTRWRSGTNQPNFGDDLSHAIVTLVLARHGQTLEDEAARDRELLAIGSILHMAADGAVVWGSGVNGKIPEDRHRFRTLDVRAVRGPLTAEWLRRHRGIEVPDIYGDPALLLPSLCQGRFAASGTVAHVFVPNLNDLLHGVAQDLPEGVELVSPMQSWARAVAAITAARFVSASSLHGLVIAEAFGIPARYVRLSQHEDPFKYRDYYAGTGREGFEQANSVAAAAEMGGEPPPRFDPARLTAAFPLDLWT